MANTELYSTSDGDKEGIVTLILEISIENPEMSMGELLADITDRDLYELNDNELYNMLIQYQYHRK